MMWFKKIQPWLFKPTFWLALILALGLWLRLDQLDRKLWLNDSQDDARDVIVAKHMVEYHETVWRGPFVAGGYFWLENSPVYYYFLALLWWLAGTPEKLITAWAVVTSFGIVLSYWAGKLTRDPLTGLLAALIFALHPSLILQGSQILQPHLLPLFSLASYICLIQGWRQKSGWWLVGAIWAMLFPLHIHYAIGILFPIFGLAYLYLLWQMIGHRWSGWLEILIYIIGSGWALGLSWVLLTYHVHPFDQLRFFELNKTFASEPFQIRFTETIVRASQLLLGFIPGWSWAVMGVISLGLGLLTQIQLRQKSKSLWYWLLGTIFLTSGVVFLFQGYVANTYLLGLLPFYLLFFALGLRSIWQVKWWLGLIGLIGIGFWSAQQIHFTLSQDIPQFGYAGHFKAGAAAIYKDSTLLSPEKPDFVITALASFNHVVFDAWRVGVYWFYLEDFFGQQLVKLTDYDVSFWPLVTAPKYIYLVCDHRWQPEREQAMCYQPFVKVRKHLDLGKQIFKDETQTIWRFNVKPGLELQPWWYIYRKN